jgi:hypothetical protein
VNYRRLRWASLDAIGRPVGVYDDRAGEACNQVLEELCSSERLAEPLIPLVVTPGVGDYSLSTGLGVSNAIKVRDVYYQPVGQVQAGAPLDRTSPSRIDEIRARNTSNSYPMQYAVGGIDSLMLAPVPSDAGTLSVRVVAEAVQMAADSDVPLTLPLEFHDLIWRGAAIMLGEQLRPTAVAQLAARQQSRLGDFRSWMRDLGGEKPLRMQRRGDTIPNRDRSVYPAVESY